MLKELLKPGPIISDHSAKWLLECFAWALKKYDGDAFQQCQLVLPSNQFFPGRVDSVHGMSRAIFDRVVDYAGLSHWPFQLVRPENYLEAPTPKLALPTSRRHLDNAAAVSGQSISGQSMKLLISYRPQQIKQPQAMAANYAHIIAQHLVYQSGHTPPGGQDYFAQATELISIFMGFGLLITNSAYTFRSGCGSCYDPAANRSASLSENEALFALVVFCELKKIPASAVFKHLKKHLRSTYKRALKQLADYPDQVAQLHTLIGSRA